jgi:opacity protein-like surface antigen
MNNCTKALLISMLLVSANFGQSFTPGDAQGVFMTLGVGPRFPIGELGSQQTIGAGFDVMLSYTDNNFAPVFFYLNIGYQNHPGDYDYYKISDHSSISTNIVSFHAGSRYYFEPLIDDMILLMPILEGGITYGYVEKYHQFKIDAGRNDNLQSLSKFGFHIGGGLSFFLMDVIATFNYLENNQYFSFNLRLTIPLAITL